jgi:translation initiation factor IF-2
MHKGLGSVATLLVQNGTLKKGDALVLGNLWGRVKTMRDETGREVTAATPSTPVEITGISGLPKAGDEFIVVKSEKEARNIAEARAEEGEEKGLSQAKKPLSMEHLLQQSTDSQKKVLNIVLRADMQGSLEALKTAFAKIESEKIDLNVIFSGIGEVSESDVQLAAASKACIIGFHTQIESHSESLIKELGVQVYMYDIIYHAIDKVKEVMTGMLDRVSEEQNRGAAQVKQTFKVSHLGVIAGCQVIEGNIHRNHTMRVMRQGEAVWTGGIASIKREKDDVREIKNGLECGILLDGFNAFEIDDILQSFEVVYHSQEL